MAGDRFVKDSDPDKSGVVAVIFDLDGVIVSTDECHYEAWKRLADEEGIPFDRQTNNRLRGVSRMESLEIILEKAPREYSGEEKIVLAERKNDYYKQLLNSLDPCNILPGALGLINALKKQGIRIAIGSSSKNCRTILDRVGLTHMFDVIVDGNCISKSKPDPEVFLEAAKRLGVSARHCVVIEDAEAGVQAALAANMAVIGVGAASLSPLATVTAPDLSHVTIETIMETLQKAKCLG
ncbi:MAG: beta-phosphoglucomutase [Armatimonadota bacterium]